MPGPYSPADTRHYYGIARQATKGTDVAPTRFVRFQEALDFTHDPQTTQVREAGAGFGVARTLKDVQNNSSGFVAPAQPDLAAFLFAMLLGDDSIAGAGDPYTHTITPSVAMNWLSVERNLADEVIERTVDSVLMELVLDIRKRDAGTELLLTGSVMGLDVIRQVAATAESYEADDPFVRSMATWTVDGVANTNVESATLTFTWNYDEAMLTDAVTRANTIKTTLEVEAEVVQLFASQDELDAYIATHYNALVAGTASGETIYEGAFNVNFADGGSPARSLDVDIPRMTWADAQLTEANPSGSEGTRITRSGFAATPSGSPIVTVTAETPTSTVYTA